MSAIACLHTHGEAHFHSILVSKQAICHHADEMFNNGPVTKDFSVSSLKICLVVPHLFCYSTQKLTLRVNLQHLRPCQGAVLIDLLQGFRNLSQVLPSQKLSFFVAAGHIDKSQHILEDFAPTG